MAIIDNSNNNMSTKEIKDVLINTFKRSAEKSVHEASYDKTILATIQYCIDATIGQYKIKYQNGYFTAYAKEKDIVYSDKASVYVLVPGNNMSNKMFITGLAGDDSSQRISLNNLEGDQQYALNGGDFISNSPTEDSMKMCSYWSASDESHIYLKTLYTVGGDSNILTLDVDSIERTMSNGGEYLRIGASFKTDLPEYQLNVPAANYGIIVTVKYKKDDGTEELKAYTIDTLNMKGTPFSFSSYVPQYQFYEIDAAHFVRIERIEEFCSGFDAPDPLPDPDEYDIFVKDISIHNAYKVYDSADSPYAVRVEPDGRGNAFDTDPLITDLPYTAILTKYGIPVQDEGVQYYWGKQDASVSNVNHKKYCEYLGAGWYCLNPAYVTSGAEGGQGSDKSTVDMTTPLSSLEGKTLDWVTNCKSLVLKDKLFPGKRTQIKVVVVYENNLYVSQEVTIFNDSGKVILIDNPQAGSRFYNGEGTVTLTAAVFQDKNVPAQETPPLNYTFGRSDCSIEYVWTEIDSFGQQKSLPSEAPSERYNSFGEWDQEQDNVDKTDTEVTNYLNQYPLARYCIERYSYYSSAKDNENYTSSQRQVAKTRYDGIVSGRTTEILQQFTSNYGGSDKNYILGPSAITGIIDANGQAAIDTITPYYFDTQSTNWDRYKAYQNTLLQVNAKNIDDYVIYRLTVIQTDTQDGFRQALGTEEIVLYNDKSGNLKYDLVIDGGDLSFLYSETGVAPTSENYNHTTMSLKPLSFRLYDNGSLIYDSSKDASDVANSTVSIESLKPVWKFFNPTYSLIQTRYNGGVNCSADPTDSRIWLVKNEPQFYYELKENFNASLVNQSNIQLQVTYDSTIVTATTHFSFAKQGDLNTNGTSMYLRILDQTYKNYKDELLTNKMYCEITETDGTVKWYSPNQRHLNNTYLYATQCYDSSGTVCRLDSARFSNLKFAARANTSTSYGPGNILIGLEGSSNITLTASWFENSTVSPIEIDSKWTAETFEDNSVLYTPSYNFTSVSPASGEYEGTKVFVGTILQTNKNYGYKPTKITNFNYNSKTVTRVAQNIVKLEASRNVPEQTDPVTGLETLRTCYGYYSMPYYYYNYFYSNNLTGSAPSGLDPARHIVIVDGFDTITYNEAGLEPQYNQSPFKLFLFDENGKNITASLLEEAKANRANITWECSPGLSIRNTNLDTPSYVSFASTPYTPLLGRYCTYGEDNKVYRCIVNHIYQHGTVTIPETGITYTDSQFIPSYWEEIGTYSTKSQCCEIIPALRYESLAHASLFNSWVSVKITNFHHGDYTYEAEAFIPINVFCNRYGSEELNNWDGKKTKVDDAYIISNKIAAGVKNADNTFTGITIGQTFYMNNQNKHSEIGLFGYGRPKANTTAHDELTWNRTIFMDAHTGRTILGPSGSSQIVLNPAPESWSRLAGWYFHPNFLYKPVGEGDAPPEFTEYSQGCDIKPPDDVNFLQGSAGMYVPWSGTVGASDVFLWASSKEKDLDLSEITDELTAMQANLSANYGITFGPGTYGDITNQATLEKKYGDQVNIFAGYSSLISFGIEKNYWFTITSDRDPWNDYYKKTYNKELKSLFPGNYYCPYDAFPDPDGTSHYDDPEDGYDMFIDSAILEEHPLDDSKKEEYKAVKKVRKNYDNLKSSYLDQLNHLTEDCNNYTTLVKRYRDLLESESQAKVVSYKDFNNKRSNFYVTYGGKLHAASAEIEGKITATSGSFGNGSNKILISTVKNGKSYILYNKNFWVRDGSTGDPEIYMKGTIKAKSGQIGKITEDTNGDSNNTLFIQYTWYQWHFPDDDEAWSELKEDIESGKTQKYVLYNKNFFIENSGEAFFRGKIYSKKGRLGDWVINETDLRDITSNIILHPASLSSSSASSSYIKIGKNNNNYNLEIIGDGSMHGPRKPGDAQTRPYYWSISSTGQAYFDHPENVVRAQTVYLGSGNNSPSITSAGLSFPEGTHIAVGSKTLSIGPSGFSFNGNVGFTNSEVDFGNGAFIRSGQFITSNGGTTLSVGPGGVSFGSASGQQTLNSSGFSGNLKKTVTIDGIVLAEYIKDIVSGMQVTFVEGTNYTVSPMTEGVNAVVLIKSGTISR